MRNIHRFFKQESEKDMIQYYEVYNITTQQSEIWRGDTTRSDYLLTIAKYIKPLGAHKPKKSMLTNKEIKSF